MMAELEDTLNRLIKNLKSENKIDPNLIEDTLHSFGELYSHRIELYIQLCKVITNDGYSKHRVWKAKFHSDNTSYEGWFILGIDMEAGKQITYHLPLERWDDIDCMRLSSAPTWDGHISKDVLERLKDL